tara:strand:- start:80 stop:571 length:492 start_codon:yes stop_codon:yes gene_type:complete
MPTKPIVSTFNYVGDIKPTGYFDPLRLSGNADEALIKYLREAELQHGRVAMLAALALPVLDLTNDKLAINVLKDIPLEEQVPFWLSVGLFETARMGAGWKNPFMLRNSYFKLEEGYQPGNVFKVPPNKYTDAALEKELSNGRLAMLGSLGYIAQELVHQHPVV